MDFRRARHGLVETAFSAMVRNEGEAPGPVGQAVKVTLDSGKPEVAHLLEELPGGGEIFFLFKRWLIPGEHTIALNVGDYTASRDMVVSVADLVVEPLGHSVTGDGFIALRARVTNQGDMAAGRVDFSAQWTPKDGGAPPGESQWIGAIEGLEPEESATVTLPVEIPTGSYDFTIAVETETIEVLTDQNDASLPVEVDYVQLMVVANAVTQLCFEPAGSSKMIFDLTVTNQGLAPTGPLETGVACPPGSAEGCSQSVALESIPPGGVADASVTVSLTSGENDVSIFAGAMEHGFRWGNQNIDTLTVNVPKRPPLSISSEADASLVGYRSDGTADVEISLALSNDSEALFLDAELVEVTCWQDGRLVSGCLAEATFDMPDGFQSEFKTLTVTAPQGDVTFEFNFGGVEPTMLDFHVPPRIVGVTPEVWECFTDRPGLSVVRSEGDHVGGCASWGSETIRKWSQDEPVVVWATGDPVYIRWLKDSFNELSPLLNLRFRYVDDEDEANLKAYVGVPASQAASIGFSGLCGDTLGCARITRSFNGEVKGAMFSVWANTNQQWRELGLLDDIIKRTIIHEALHVLVPMQHRLHPSSVMNVHNSLDVPRLSHMDEDLIRLHSHPLVKPRMTMDEVEALIVFNDDLVNPPPPEELDGYHVAERAFAVLQEADSFRFVMSGSWSGEGCGETFGPSNAAISGFTSYGSSLIHFQDDIRDIYGISSPDASLDPEYWVQSPDRSWLKVADNARLQNIIWRSRLNSPHIMLASILFFGEPDDFIVSRNGDGTITLKVAVDAAFIMVNWSDGEALDVEMVLDEETYEMREYKMDWQFDVPDAYCSGYTVEVTRGEYGVQIDIPWIIRRDSAFLPEQ